MAENNLTQDMMARMLDTSPSHLSRVLNGHKRPGWKITEAANNLPGIREEYKIEKILTVLLRGWNTGKVEQEILEKCIKIADKKIINPQD